MVEQWPFKPLVAGSSPAALTAETQLEWVFFVKPALRIAGIAVLATVQDVDFYHCYHLLSQNQKSPPPKRRAR
jgi:hypothetical protein